MFNSLGLASKHLAWFGANDIASEGTYVWSDGSPWNYVKKAGGLRYEPTPGTHENCGLVGFVGYTGFMNGVCQRHMTGFCKTTAK